MKLFPDDIQPTLPHIVGHPLFLANTFSLTCLQLPFHIHHPPTFFHPTNNNKICPLPIIPNSLNKPPIRRIHINSFQLKSNQKNSFFHHKSFVRPDTPTASISNPLPPHAPTKKFPTQQHNNTTKRTKYTYRASTIPSRMVMEIDREDERPDIVMTVTDKDSINKFSRHLARKNELILKIKGRQKLIELHTDAADELLLQDDDAPVHHAVGDVFIMDHKEQIEATLDATIADLSNDVQQWQEEVKTIADDMAALKANLYAKFGKTINLEE